jgi:DNA-binding response OmpR family regulator
MKILIAEDDNVSRLVLASTLKKQGHEVVAAENGLEALEAFQKDYFPVLILDWLTPGMDGLRCAAKSAICSSKITPTSSCSPHSKTRREVQLPRSDGCRCG